MAYVTGYSAERALRLLKSINEITELHDTNITDAVKHLRIISNSIENKDIVYDVKMVELYSVDVSTDAMIIMEEGGV